MPSSAIPAARIRYLIDLLAQIPDPLKKRGRRHPPRGEEDGPAFHVVVPSLPGFGYSGKPATTGWGTEKIAVAWVELMGRLGYDEFLAHGGDWGGNITTVLAGRFPEQVLGIHTTFAEGLPGASMDGLTALEREWAEETRHFWRHRAAYAKQQATRPQTIGYSLVDSPAGLLAWILDKFAEWSPYRGQPVRDDFDRPHSRRRHPLLADPRRPAFTTKATTRWIRNSGSTSRPRSPCIPATSNGIRAPGRRSGTGRSSAGGSPRCPGIS